MKVPKETGLYPIVMLIVGLLQQKQFLVRKDDVINSVPSKELSAFLDLCSSLSVGQAVNFLLFCMASGTNHFQ
jgi:hypothetical protein